MATFPKIDSAGLRAAKTMGGERVASVVRVKREGLRKSGQERRGTPVQNGGVNGHQDVQPEGGRKESP